MNCFARCALAAVVGGALFLGHPAACAAQQKSPTRSEHEASYKFDAAGIQLEGTLVERKVYGPPGYGETRAKDKRDTILILKLSHPITVEPTANAEASGSASLDTKKHVHEVQLFVDRSRTAEARKLLGKVIVAVGTLSEAAAPSQYTKVWLDAKTLTPK